MYCWVIATPFPDYVDGAWTDPEKLQIYGGVDEEEAVAIAKDAAPYYRKVTAKAMGGVLLYCQVNPEIAYASYHVLGFDDDHHGGVFPKADLYESRDRKEAIDTARSHAGEFDRVEVLAMGEYEDGFDSRGAIVTFLRDQAKR